MVHRKKQTERLLMEHYQLYPELQIKDIFKFLYQSSFGCEHLAMDLENTIRRIDTEMTKCQLHRGELIEDLDGEFCRVHLDWIKSGLSAETLGKLFVLSADSMENGKELLEEKLSVFVEMVNKEKLPFAIDEVKEEIGIWREDGYPACRHSEKYRSNYLPAYRVIKKEYATFLPLFLKIDSALKKGAVNLAVEGGSASGKTTLSQMLQEVYGATVFHMDDFFLRPWQRTEERFSQPGGNVDWERFLEEVLVPLKNREPINYKRFNCSTLTLEPAISLLPSKLNIIEGAYSMHPKLAEI